MSGWESLLAGSGSTVAGSTAAGAGVNTLGGVVGSTIGGTIGADAGLAALTSGQAGTVLSSNAGGSVLQGTPAAPATSGAIIPPSQLNGIAAAPSRSQSLVSALSQGYAKPFQMPDGLAQGVGQFAGLKQKGLIGSLASSFLGPVQDQYKQSIQDQAFEGGIDSLGPTPLSAPLGQIAGYNPQDPFAFNTRNAFGSPFEPPANSYADVGKTTGTGILTSGLFSGLLSGG